MTKWEDYIITVAPNDKIRDLIRCCRSFDSIVRCRDCVKWSFFDTDDGIRFGECSEFTAKVDEGAGHATREDGFCAWGERKVVDE